MPLRSEISVPSAKFNPANASEQSRKLNDALMAMMEKGPKWYEVGAAKYRQMRKAGQTPLPAPKELPQALNIKIPSREDGRDIPCRLVYPESRNTPEERAKCKGVVMHFHGGGWVLGDEKSTDDLLQDYANWCDLAVVSVGYRHAPENPFPAGPEDCYDAGEYLVKNAESQYGGPLKFIGGESAGAHLSLLTIFHLLPLFPSLNLAGLLLHFGCFDVSCLPSVSLFKKELILSPAVISHFINAFVPNRSAADLKHPSISPYYQDLEKFRGRLPPALFTIGTEDPLMDDSVNMGVRWEMAGAKGVVRVYPGAPHGFIRYPREVLAEAGQAMDDTKEFMEDCLGA